MRTAEADVCSVCVLWSLCQTIMLFSICQICWIYIFCSKFPVCQVTTCLSSHMTLFGGGFFVQPHSLDFKFIFAESDFSVGHIDIVSFV